LLWNSNDEILATEGERGKKRRRTGEEGRGNFDISCLSLFIKGKMVNSGVIC